MTLEPGTELGPYEIQSLLGAGGMGEFYKAKDIRLERTVAVKVCPVIPVMMNEIPSVINWSHKAPRLEAEMKDPQEGAHVALGQLVRTVRIKRA